MMRVKSTRRVECPLCGGTGFVYTEWFAFRPVPGSETECPECEGIGRVPEVLEEISPLGGGGVVHLEATGEDEEAAARRLAGLVAEALGLLVRA